MRGKRWGVLACSVILAVGCAKSAKQEVAVAEASEEKYYPANQDSNAPIDRIEVTGSRVRSQGSAGESESVAYLQAPPPRPAEPAPIALSDPTRMPIPLSPPAPPPPPSDHAEPAAPTPVIRNSWQITQQSSVSTFSIDVDTGSYTLARKYLTDGRLPSPHLVRTEEFINYFDHDYPRPAKADTPFAVYTEIAPAPWNPQRFLLQVGIQGYEVDQRDLPPANLVFLIDTSGSMQSADKLPLLKQGFASLVERLRAQDRVAIVTYAGSAGLVLPSTAGDQQRAILAALDKLEAGGSTNGGAGIELAYKVAKESRIAGGINRVILATDGDFNVGTTSVDALKKLVEQQRASGTALTTLGFGGYAYNDEMSEQLADIGDGNHAFIDDQLEARKVLVREMGGTLLTIARDVKIQLEFNPVLVPKYRLLGYENRMLRREDFANDQIDAGEIGAGHDVTALYELELADVRQAEALLATLRLRYKPAEEQAQRRDQSRLIEHRLLARDVLPVPGPRLRFAAAVAGFAEKLHGSEALATTSYSELGSWVQTHPQAKDAQERTELIELMELSAALAENKTVAR
ncbi:vWA domain-containing protein [Pseudomarimonas arenosa]|uniref:VWA domain-containing protein n=1 Tax=Pseudomarimonas arenosa TaxID=2774145 RepID=A0AAW3ZPN5_9GAMM|nr:VWA domain-containing protein [Pseudomarimonas arenosa]MBD8527057.1 VWA domain-containing protein [Pseudomarimonas arenosa]